ncbi:hypothetical protein GXW83_24470 [Streptacidiphilus sp. PB12-B1b]|uniref:hypothetical protein n=1 Tax=Streptacidiphilus sp. PB12-B1b TaxID=2705012 RepID=UPI0015FA062C|nr:hypothetical protein [Streptacidiphilus sp. PB12-B1b]QMU78393.1 hypothetical protein GXW83_24470 [Streptacidiphilus sp. PB12-B1b]
MPHHALDAVWACHAALAGAVDSSPGDDGAHLANLLPDYLQVVHGTDLRGVIASLERVLAVLTLDLPGTYELVTRALLRQDLTADNRAAFNEVLTAWRSAGVDC